MRNQAFPNDAQDRARAASFAARAIPVPKDTDATLAANSDALVPSQAAVKSYVDSAVAVATGSTSIDVRPGDWYFSINPGTTSATFFGFAAGSFTSIGTPSGVGVTATNTFTRQARAKRATNAAAGSSAGRVPDANSLTACLDGGFKLVSYFGNADAAPVANARFMVGLSAYSSAPANADPSASVNLIVVGADSGDSNLQIIHNDGSGTATKVDLGANFPANTSVTDWYEVTMTSEPASNAVTVTVRRTGTAYTDTRTISTDLPAGSTLLGPILWRNNGSTALAATIADGGLYFRPNLEKG